MDSVMKELLQQLLNGEKKIDKLTYSEGMAVMKYARFLIKNDDKESEPIKRIITVIVKIELLLDEKERRAIALN